MSNYTIKLCDHATQPNQSQGAVQTALQSSLHPSLQRNFGQRHGELGHGLGNQRRCGALRGQQGSRLLHCAVVGKQKLDNISEYAGGHTTMHHHEICSEIYQTVVFKPPRTGTRTLDPLAQAKLAFHECIHNVFPCWSEADLNGHGGLDNTPVGSDLSQWDIDTMRRGLSIHSIAKQNL